MFNFGENSWTSDLFEAVIIILIIYGLWWYYKTYVAKSPSPSYTAIAAAPMPAEYKTFHAPPPPALMDKTSMQSIQVAQNIHNQGPSLDYQNNRFQETSNRQRSELPVSENQSREEYMTNKYNTSYMQATASQPEAINYNEYMISTGLESSVVASHKDFVDETQNKTTGASTETVFSHDDAIVPSWGLRRRSAAVPIGDNSREVPSQTNEQITDNTGGFKYGLF